MNRLFQPAWYDWTNYDTIQGVYEEPEDTIEMIFIGASIMAVGVTPMELYEQYGICSYNMGMEAQPVQASYYWLEEVYRLQGDTLKTVVLDTSLLRYEPDQSIFRKSIDTMHFSQVKWNAVSDYTDGTLNATLSYLIPLFGYHARWSELSASDITKQDYDEKTYTRGYDFNTYTNYIQSNTQEDLLVLSSYPDEFASEQELNTASLYYLQKMIDFCDEHDLKLVLMKTPGQSLGSSGHNAVQSIADEYGLDFLDFNYEPLTSEIGYNHATDSMDGTHMNYYGAAKLTSWLGNYLVEECGATDVRGLEGYGYLEEQLAEYKEKIANVVELKAETDPAAYLSNVMSLDGYTVFVAVQDEASSSLTEDQRETFANLGLMALSDVDFHDSYLAVIDDGEVVYEEREPEPSDGEDSMDTEESGTGNPNEMSDLTMEDVRASRETEAEEVLYLMTEGTLSDGTRYLVKSGGYNLGNIASVQLDGTEYAVNTRGINIVVYDKERHEVYDSTVFDTWASSERVSGNLEEALEEALQETSDYTTLSENLQKLYLYNLRCENARIAEEAEQAAGDDGLLEYLDAMLDNDRYAVFLAVQDDGGKRLSDAVREALRERGLTGLSELSYRDSYLAVLQGGELVYEAADHGESPLEQYGEWIPDLPGSTSIFYHLKSGGWDSEEVTASIRINNTEYATGTRGINIVVWDVVTNEVVASKTFDTYGIPVRLAESTDE